jgi:hypothetical protein
MISYYSSLPPSYSSPLLIISINRTLSQDFSKPGGHKAEGLEDNNHRHQNDSYLEKINSYLIMIPLSTENESLGSP